MESAGSADSLGGAPAAPDSPAALAVPAALAGASAVSDDSAGLADDSAAASAVSDDSAGLEASQDYSQDFGQQPETHQDPEPEQDFSQDFDQEPETPETRNQDPETPETPNQDPETDPETPETHGPGLDVLIDFAYLRVVSRQLGSAKLDVGAFLGRVQAAVGAPGPVRAWACDGGPEDDRLRAEEHAALAAQGVALETFPCGARRVRCERCHASTRVPHQKQVDTAIALKLLEVGGCLTPVAGAEDTSTSTTKAAPLVLVASDRDFEPALAAVRARRPELPLLLAFRRGTMNAGFAESLAQLRVALLPLCPLVAAGVDLVDFAGASLAPGGEGLGALVAALGELAPADDVRLHMEWSALESAGLAQVDAALAARPELRVGELWAHHCRLDDAACEGPVAAMVARYPGLAQVHLSHNAGVTPAGVVAVVRAAVAAAPARQQALYFNAMLPGDEGEVRRAVQALLPADARVSFLPHNKLEGAHVDLKLSASSGPPSWSRSPGRGSPGRGRGSPGRGRGSPGRGRGRGRWSPGRGSPAGGRGSPAGGRGSPAGGRGSSPGGRGSSPGGRDKKGKNKHKAAAKAANYARLYRLE